MRIRIASYFILILVCLTLSGCNENTEVKNPNFLVIIVDDLGYYDLSCQGSNYYETPSIDRISSNGMIFTNGYSNSAVCSPSRASIFTGLYTAHHGITDYIGARTGVEWRKSNRYTKLLPASYEHFLSHDFRTLPETLHENQYVTFFAGKWHLGSEKEGSLPTDHGFDINRGGYEAGGPYSGGYFSPFNNPFLTDKENEKGMTLSMKLATETAGFIKENRDSKFLACLAFYGVHAPIQTTQEKWIKYRDKAASMGINENGFYMERRLPIRKYQDNPVYAGLVEQVDDAVGYVINTLEETGLLESTVIIFMSDNGGVASGDNFSTSNLPLRGGKGYQWEAGIKVPFFIWVPWLENKGNKEDTPVTGADIYPTIMELAGIKKPEGKIDGTSLVPLLKGNKIESRKLYWHYPHYGNQGGEPNSIIRDDKWKLIHYWEDGRNELYNLADDPGEKNDISEQFPEIMNSLRSDLLTWLEESNAKYPVIDTLYDETFSNNRLTESNKRLITRLEKNRLLMLDPDWKPNDNWWGSSVAIK